MQTMLVGASHGDVYDDTSAAIATPDKKVFLHLTNFLRKRVRFPLYLPSLRALSARAPYLEIVEDASYKYDVELARAPNCMGGSCTVGEIVGHETHDATTPPLEGTRVLLQSGITAFWTAHDCPYIGCDYSALTFESGGHFYEVALLNSTVDSVRQLADSMSAVK